MHVDPSETSEGFSLRDILPRSARFLHREYFGVHGGKESQWIDWLCNIVGLNDAPRIVEGFLSPEFKEMAVEVSSRELLLVLKQYWSRIAGRLRNVGIWQLSQTEVECENGVVLPLKDTSLKRKTLARYPLLDSLPIDNPNDSSWDFLRTFGVSIEVNLHFLIKLLRVWQEEDRKDVPVENVYKQLEARCEEDDCSML
jgi:hypothetical protein